MKESDLYPAVAGYFQKKGYEVKGEVNGCDLVAIKKDHIVIVELKLQFNVKLLYQAVRRLSITTDVYIAIPKPKIKQKISFWTMTKSLCRRLQIGLFIIDGTSVKPAAEPGTFRSSANTRNKNKLLKEFYGRKAGSNTGGITGVKLETAYLESSVQIAVMLTKAKKSSASELIKAGCAENAYAILYNNHYGWFEKKDKGIYALKKGMKNTIQKKHPKIWQYYLNNS